MLRHTDRFHENIQMNIIDKRVPNTHLALLCELSVFSKCLKSKVILLELDREYFETLCARPLQFSY